MPARIRKLMIVATVTIPSIGGTVESNELPDFDALWNYSAPAETRAEFEKILPAAEKGGNHGYHLELLTQIARTHGLEGNFEEAHELLDRVEQNVEAGDSVVRLRLLLERGRSYRSGGKPEAARPIFEEAYALGGRLGADYLTIDAAHMVAITADDGEERRHWSLMGIELAEKSSDPKARHWIGSICNNLGWDYHGAGEFEKALEQFEKALAIRVEEKSESEIGIARWCIARCYRSLKRNDEALEIQLELEKNNEDSGSGDGYVFEELGELYLSNGEAERARNYFVRAYEVLSKDSWMMENEKERMERMKMLAGLSD